MVPALAHRPVAVVSTPSAALQSADETVCVVVLLKTLPCVCVALPVRAPPLTEAEIVSFRALAVADAAVSGDSDVDRVATFELVVRSPVDNDVMLVEVEVDSELIVVDSAATAVDDDVVNAPTFVEVEVERLATALLVVLRPVDKEPISVVS
jgi:hypothetical protein